MNTKRWINISFVILAFLITLLSSQFHWYTDRTFGTECSQPAEDGKCYIPSLQAGFPLPYLIDQNGVSVMGQLNPIIEDPFLPHVFLIDMLLYFIFFYGVYAIFVEIKNRFSKHE